MQAERQIKQVLTSQMDSDKCKKAKWLVKTRQTKLLPPPKSISVQGLISWQARRRVKIRPAPWPAQLLNQVENIILFYTYNWIIYVSLTTHCHMFAHNYLSFPGN